MKRGMNAGLAKRLLLAASMASFVLVPGLARAATQSQDIGAVQLVRIWATGTPVEAQTRDLFVENPIFRNEVVETVRDGGLHLRFKDDTEFRLGSNSRATLDKFVYDPDSRDGELALSLKEGVFRFKTGQMKKEGIRILTAVAEIEVHGTDLVIEVLDDGTIRVTVTSGEASMTSRHDGTKVVMSPGDGGQVAPGGSAKPYAGLVGAGDLGIADAAGFETAPAISTASTQFDGGLTQLMYQSASAGQTISALSPLAVFTEDSQQALETVVTGESPFAAAPSAPSDLVAFAPTVATDGTVTDAVSNAVTNSVITAMTNTVTDTMTDTMIGATPTINIPLDVMFHLMIQWGIAGDDLDLHLTGPDGRGERFHVYHGDRGSLVDQPFAELDRDCICFAGAEVISVSGVNEGDVYRVSTFNFGDQSFDSNNLAAESDVEFSLYSGGQVVDDPNAPGGFTIQGGDLLATVSPDSTDAGNTWLIGEADPTTGELTLINEITNSDSSSSVP